MAVFYGTYDRMAGLSYLKKVLMRGVRRHTIPSPGWMLEHVSRENAATGLIPGYSKLSGGDSE
jgi:hypothetical protein